MKDTDEDPTMVDLGFCIGAECLRLHGVRLATYRGRGPCSAYIICDECYRERLDDEERKHMAEVRGVEWVRHLGLHELHHGRLPDLGALDAAGGP